MEFHLHPTLAQDTEFVTDLALCRVLLMRDATYPWVILVPRRAGLRELVDLDETDAASLTAEIRQTSRVLQALYAPFKLNVAALGNMVEQLHIHIIVRRQGDPAWPRPIWGAVPPSPYEPASLHRTLDELRSVLLDQDSTNPLRPAAI